MQYVILGALAIAILYGVAQLYANLSTSTLLRILRFGGGGLALIAGIALTIGRQFLGLPLVLLGLILLYGRFDLFGLGTGNRSAGTASSVRARFVEAALDHDSGALTGRVRIGKFAGRDLDDLSRGELHELYAEVAVDPDSMSLVEAYLDRRFPGWRDDAEEDVDAGTGRTADSGAMTDQEAYEILGLSPGAGEAEIRAAHRRLLKGVHPDQGGSTFLAARINQAKDRLLGKHR